MKKTVIALGVKYAKKFDRTDLTPEQFRVTAEELAEYEKNREKDIVPYEQRVVNRIRAVYSIDDELAKSGEPTIGTPFNCISAEIEPSSPLRP